MAEIYMLGFPLPRGLEPWDYSKMAHRTRSRDRCLRCHMRRVLCFCELVPQFDLKTRVIVLLHNRESKRPTNTGRLLSLALTNYELRIRGGETPMDEKGLVVPERETLLLYPSSRSVELTPVFLRTITKPVSLIVPDGSWRQASKVMNRVKALKEVIHVKPPVGLAPPLRLRRETKIGGLSTFEAVARALGAIENLDVQEKLEKVFEILAERTLWSRAQLLDTDCKNPIPPRAYLPNGQPERH